MAIRTVSPGHTRTVSIQPRALTVRPFPNRAALDAPAGVLVSLASIFSLIQKKRRFATGQERKTRRTCANFQRPNDIRHAERPAGNRKEMFLLKVFGGYGIKPIVTKRPSCHLFAVPCAGIPPGDQASERKQSPSFRHIPFLSKLQLYHRIVCPGGKQNKLRAMQLRYEAVPWRWSDHFVGATGRARGVVSGSIPVQVQVRSDRKANADRAAHNAPGQ